MAKIDQEYHKLLETILKEGYNYEDPNRKDVYRTEIQSYTFRHEFKNGFPAITTKELNYNNIIVELLWFLKGDTNIKYLVDNKCNIWNKDAYKYYLKNNNTELEGMTYKQFTEMVKVMKHKDSLTPWFSNGYGIGDLGPVYGHQWRNFNGLDQISKLIKGLKEKPLGTEHIVNSWNASDIHDMALPPCHYGFQIVVKPLDELDRYEMCSSNDLDNLIKVKPSERKDILDKLIKPEYGFELHWTQRSVDTFLGLPYNIASYATLALILEKITGYKALGIQGDLKKVHLYDNSLEGIKEQLSRNFSTYNKCDLLFKDEFHYITDKTLCGDVPICEIIEKMNPNWFKLANYNSYPSINVSMLEKD